MIRTWAKIKSLLGGEVNAEGNRSDTNKSISPFTLLRDVIDSLGSIIDTAAESFPKLRVGGAVNYTNIDEDGVLTMTDTVWDDMRAPFTQTKRGALDKPDFDYTNVGLLFKQNDPAEIVYIIFQLPHAYK